MLEYYMTILLASTLAFAVAYWELVTSKYPRTFFLVSRCKYLLLYSFVYAIMAAVVMVVYDLIAPHEGPHSAVGKNLWFRALMVGLFTKSFLHFRAFTIPGKPEPTPVGIETVMQVFEPYLLKEIELAHDTREVQFVKLRLPPGPIDFIRTQILSNLPTDMNKQDEDGFRTTIEKATSAQRAATFYFRLVGRERFEITFPPPSNEAVAAQPALPTPEKPPPPSPKAE